MMKKTIDAYVLDTSAILALIEDEEGADVVFDLLEKSGAGNIVIFVSFMSFMEVYYITLREHDETEAQVRLQLMNSMPILRVDSNETLGILASQFKVSYHLSNADAWIAALAKDRNAIWVHKDPEFEQVEMEINVLKLPYKTK
ncbi:PIN domain-containing protein [bacterium]|nr:PIN domain-containing protein [bacterium]